MDSTPAGALSYNAARMGQGTPISEASDVINEDIPCASCAYNLRGLQESGKCPECGGDIGESLDSWQRKRLRQPDPIVVADLRWVRGLIEGLTFSLVGYALILGLAIAPTWAYQQQSSPRVVMLGVALTAWVMCWYGVWQLTAADPARRETGRERLLRMIIRINTILFCSTPFLIALAPGPETWPVWLVVPLGFTYMVGGMTAGGAYYLHLLLLAGRMQSTARVNAAAVLALANTAVFIGPLLPTLHRYSSSLEQLISMPTCQFGAPMFLRDSLRELGDLGYRSFTSPSYTLEVATVVIFLAAGAFHVAMLLGLLRAAHTIRAGQLIQAKQRQETAANSPP